MVHSLSSPFLPSSPLSCPLFVRSRAFVLSLVFIALSTPCTRIAVPRRRRRRASHAPSRRRSVLLARCRGAVAPFARRSIRSTRPQRRLSTKPDNTPTATDSVRCGELFGAAADADRQTGRRRDQRVTTYEDRAVRPGYDMYRRIELRLSYRQINCGRPGLVKSDAFSHSIHCRSRLSRTRSFFSPCCLSAILPTHPFLPRVYRAANPSPAATETAAAEAAAGDRRRTLIIYRNQVATADSKVGIIAISLSFCSVCRIAVVRTFL